LEREIERKRQRDRERREKKGTRRDRGEISDRRNTLPSSQSQLLSCFFKTKREEWDPVVRAELFVIVCKMWLRLY